MAPRIVELDLGVSWEPNAPDARFTVESGAARLVLLPHPDDPDPRPVVLFWPGCGLATAGAPNDEAAHLHPIRAAGGGWPTWVGEVLESRWSTDAAAMFAMPLKRHYLVPTKELTVEVLADAMSVERG